MPAVIKRNKQKSAKKVLPIKNEKKFISESLQKRKLKPGQLKKKTPKHRRRGVIYIKHLPHGFYEEQLRGYFSQFGAITRLRLARSPKTLGSKGYAFIEFRYPEVAEIAAEAMNNYIMFKNIIKTVFIPPKDIKHDYFRSGVKKVKKDGVKVLTSKTIEAREAVVLNTNKLMTADDEKERNSKIGSRIQKQKQKLAALGIDYDIDEVAQNMGDAVMQAAEKAKPKTLEHLELDSEDEADDTFDPSTLKIDSDDEFENFEYDSDNTDDDDENDVSIDNEKLDNAIKVARAATKKAVIELSKETGKNNKRKETVEPEVVAKKSKPTKGGKENKSAVKQAPTVVQKAGKKPAIEETVEAAPVPIASNATKKNLKKKVSPVVEAPAPTELPAKRVVKKTPAAIQLSEESVAKVKKPAAKKGHKKQEPQVVVSQLESPVVVNKPAKQAKSKKAPVNEPKPVPVPVADFTQKVKKTEKAEEPEAAQPLKKSQRTKKAPIAPESPAPAPVKTKKLAKASAGIEKKKPVKVVADKKLKLAASVAASSEADTIVKVVKGKEIKGKKKGGAKK